jgi:hypothetical protein
MKGIARGAVTYILPTLRLTIYNRQQLSQAG